LADAAGQLEVVLRREEAPRLGTHPQALEAALAEAAAVEEGKRQEPARVRIIKVEMERELDFSRPI
jgi:hypothetical protein